jgi:hypothetical protein
MPFINTAGLTIFGDGSQWFWSMAAFLALPITGYAIYSQLRIARSLRAKQEVEALDREWDSERLMRYRLELLTAMRNGVDSAHLPLGSAAGLSNFWQRIGQLARSGHIDARTLHWSYSKICQRWWADLAPGIRLARVERDLLHLAEDFEWLAARMAELDRRAGLPAVGSGGPIELRESITQLEGQLRVEEALRSVTVASSKPPIVGQPNRRRSETRARA